ncbi:hypothetical protein [Modicisalibacter luteus]|uniref:hypothetical protein n=1 Tax=Modicisalibacter luteus TaxID=453962 RepID=UPI00362B62D0
MNETRRAALDAAMKDLPLVAILRGVRPDEVDGIFDALVASGFKLIEIPSIRHGRGKASSEWPSAVPMMS